MIFMVFKALLQHLKKEKLFKNLLKLKCQTSIMIIPEGRSLLNDTKKVENRK